MDAIYKKIKGQFYNKLLIAIIIGVALSAVSLYFVFVCQQADDGLKIDDRFMALEVRPGSPAAEAGIRTGDRVLAIGGVRLARIGELRTVHESVMHTVSALCGVLVPHRAVPYEIQRGEAVVTVSVVPTRIGLQGLEFSVLFRFTLGLFFLLLGSLVYFRKHTDRLALIFFLYCATQSLYLTMGYYSSFWNCGIIRFLFYAVSPMKVLSGVLFLHFFSALSSPAEARAGRALRAALYALAGALIVAFAVTLFRSELFTFVYWTRDCFYYLCHGAGVAALLYQYVRNRANPDYSIKRQQIKIILYGTTVSVALYLAFKLAIIAGAGGGTNIVSENEQILTGLLFSIVPISIGSSIVRFGLFNIDRIINRSFYIVVLLAVFTAVYAGFFVLLDGALGGLFYGSGMIAGVIAFVATIVLYIVFSYQFEQLVYRLLFHNVYRVNSAIDSIIERTAAVIRQDDIIDFVAGVLRDVIGAQFACIYLREQRPQGAYQAHFEHGENRRLLPASFDGASGIVRHLGEAGRAVPVEYLEAADLAENVGDDAARLIHAAGIATAAPLYSQGRLIGFVLIGKKTGGTLFGYYDIDFVNRLLHPIALAIENISLIDSYRREQVMTNEILIAKSIQSQLLPPRLPAVPGYDIAAATHPAFDMSGDFYDVVVRDTGEVDCIVGDVSGKGVPAAFYSALVSGIIAASTYAERASDMILQSMHRVITKRYIQRFYLAACYAILRPERHALEFTNAGLIYPVRASADATEYLKSGGVPVGTRLPPRYTPHTVALEVGDLVVFATDGIIEATNADKEFFGFERYLDTVRRFRELPARGLLEKLLGAVYEHIGDTGQDDDITIVIVKRVS